MTIKHRMPAGRLRGLMCALICFGLILSLTACVRPHAVPAVEVAADEHAIDWSRVPPGHNRVRRESQYAPRRYSELVFSSEPTYQFLNWSGFRALEAEANEVMGSLVFSEDLSRAQLSLKSVTDPNFTGIEQAFDLEATIDLESGELSYGQLVNTDSLQETLNLDQWLLARVRELRERLRAERILLQRQYSSIEGRNTGAQYDDEFVIVENTEIQPREYLAVNLGEATIVSFTNPRELRFGSKAVFLGQAAFSADLMRAEITVQRQEQRFADELSRMDLEVALDTGTVVRQALDDETDPGQQALAEIPDIVWLNFIESMRREIIAELPLAYEPADGSELGWPFDYDSGEPDDEDDEKPGETDLEDTDESEDSEVTDLEDTDEGEDSVVTDPEDTEESEEDSADDDA